MRRLFILFSLWSVLAFRAHALSTEFLITRTNLDAGRFLFSVSTNVATDGVAFHIIIKAKKEAFYADSTAGVSIVTQTRTNGGLTHSIASVRPEIKVVIKKHERVWEADFTVSNQLLDKPGLCFAFTEFSHTTVNGKTAAMPSADFYEIELRDFLKQ